LRAQVIEAMRKMRRRATGATSPSPAKTSSDGDGGGAAAAAAAGAAAAADAPDLYDAVPPDVLRAAARKRSGANLYSLGKTEAASPSIGSRYVDPWKALDAGDLDV